MPMLRLSRSSSLSIRVTSLLALCSLSLSAGAQVETSTNVPPGIRALLEQQRQAGNPYEQMARMQVSARYGELLALYEGSRQGAIEAVMVEVFGRRMELSAQMTGAGANPAELERVSGADYLRSQLAESVSDEELRLFDDFLQGTSERQLRSTYGSQLERAAPALSAADRDMVLEQMVQHMLLQRSDITDPEEMITQQLQSLMAVRTELQTRLGAEQFGEAEKFLDQVQSNLYRNRGMYEAMEQ